MDNNQLSSIINMYLQMQEFEPYKHNSTFSLFFKASTHVEMTSYI